MRGTGPAALEHELRGDEHLFQAMTRDGHPHARHDLVPTLVSEQGPAQPLQRLGQVGKRGATA
jgi:hypothetical protein